MTKVIPESLIEKDSCEGNKILFSTINEVMNYKRQTNTQFIGDANSLVKLHYAFNKAKTFVERRLDFDTSINDTLIKAMYHLMTIASQSEILYINVMLNIKLAQLHLFGYPPMHKPSQEKSESNAMYALDILEENISKNKINKQNQFQPETKEWEDAVIQLFDLLEILLKDRTERVVIYKWLPKRREKLLKSLNE